MAEFLTTTGISYHLEKIIKDARSRLVLISPYIKIPPTLLERLHDVASRGVKITLIYGKTDLNIRQVTQLEEVQNIDVYYFQNLHAKCYFNEKQLLVTSMNLHEYSEKNNREMGVLIDRTQDKKMFDDAVDEAKSIREHAKPAKLMFDDDDFDFAEMEEYLGHCIRCNDDIDYDSSRPYCSDCFKVWVVYANEDFREKVCHCCGREGPSTMAAPECPECLKSKKYTKTRL